MFRRWKSNAKSAPTPLYPIFRKRVDDAIEQLIKQQVTPWASLPEGPPFRIKKFDGGEIAYAGVEFEGSPRDVFWTHYIEPFLEKLCISEISDAVSMAREKDVDARLLLPEIQALLSGGFQRVYARMAVVDRRLRGKGFPDKVEPKSIEDEVWAMNQFLGERIRTEVAMCKPKSRRELWFERNKFLTWAIPILVAIILAIAGWAKFG
jgi:hypothetical protein